MHAQDLFAALEIGHIDHDLAIEASRPQQRGIEDIGTVRGREQDYPIVAFKSIHFDEKLVERLLALVVTAAEAGAAVAADGIDFVDEDDAGRVRLALLE